MDVSPPGPRDTAEIKTAMNLARVSSVGCAPKSTASILLGKYCTEVFGKVVRYQVDTRLPTLCLKLGTPG